MRLETTRLVLREYAADDLAPLLAYQSDPRGRAFYAPDEAPGAQAPELLHTFLAWAAAEPRRNRQLAVAPRREPRALVGSCGLRQEGMDAGRAEFGIELAPEVWGRGYGAEAAAAMLDFEIGRASCRERV